MRLYAFLFLWLVVVTCQAQRISTMTTATDVVGGTLSEVSWWNGSAWVTRKVTEQMRSEFAVTNMNKTFNVIVAGDGTTDRRTEIQAEITKAGLAGGGTVVLTRGDYRLSGTLYMSNNVALVGAGPGNTKLRFLDSVGANVRMLDIQQKTNVIVEGIFFDQNFRNRGLAVANVENDCMGLGYSLNVWVSKNVFFDAGKDGINFDASKRIVVAENTFDSCGSSGVSTDGEDIIVWGNVFTNCGWRFQFTVGPHPGAIGDVATKNLVVTGNSFHTNFLGVYKNGGSPYLIGNNVFFGGPNAASTAITNILIDATSAGNISGNAMLGGIGIVLRGGSTSLTVANNQGWVNRGVIVTGGDHVTIRGNDWYCSGGSSAIDIRGGTRIGIFGNKAHSASSGIVVANDVSNLTIKDNWLTDSGGAAIAIGVRSSNHRIMGNVIQHSGPQDSINLGQGSTNCYVAWNFATNRIYINATTNNFIIGNIVGEIHVENQMATNNTFVGNLVLGKLDGSADHYGNNHMFANYGPFLNAPGLETSPAFVLPTDTFNNPIAFGHSVIFKHLDGPKIPPVGGVTQWSSNAYYFTIHNEGGVITTNLVASP